MSISDQIGSLAATNPVVGVAVAHQSVGNAILSGLQSGDTGTATLLAAVSSQALNANQLLSSLASSLGQKVNLSA